MALPVIAAAARAGAGAAKGALGGGGGEKPKAMSPEGVIMLMLAGVLECVNIIIGILDFAFGIGVILGPIVNIPGSLLIGGWLWLRSGTPPIKKALGPLVLNSIPFVKFIPWWIVAVATSLEWKSAAEQPAESQQQEDKPQNAQEQPQPAEQPA